MIQTHQLPPIVIDLTGIDTDADPETHGTTIELHRHDDRIVIQARAEPHDQLSDRPRAPGVEVLGITEQLLDEYQLDDLNSARVLGLIARHLFAQQGCEDDIYGEQLERYITRTIFDE